MAILETKNAPSPLREVAEKVEAWQRQQFKQMLFSVTEEYKWPRKPARPLQEKE